MQPFWLARQTDPASPDFVPGVAGIDPVNVTHRSWTTLGTVAAPARGAVDPRGLVTASAGAGARDGIGAGVRSGWSLDWWIGADDRWHTPSTDAAVRQRLVGEAPVVETVVRIPGGDAVQRVYAIHATGDSPFGQPFLIVEFENQSAVPFALALAVVPFHPLGRGRVDAVRLDGSTLLVDGVPALLLPRAPARAAAAAGDVSAAVLGGLVEGSFDELVTPDGNGSAAVIFPLPHTAVLRLAMPLDAGAKPNGKVRLSSPSVVPEAEQVAKGWEVQTRRGMRLTVPDPALQSVIEAGRRHLVLAHGGDDLAAWPRRPLERADAAPVLGALGAFGFAEEVEQILATIPERQALDGSLMGPGGCAGANGAALVAVARHWRLTRQPDQVERLIGPVAKAAHWIDKRRNARRGPTFSAEDLTWSVQGLLEAAAMLDDVGQPDVAADARRFATSAADALAAMGGGPEPELSGVAVVDPVARAGLSPLRTLVLAAQEAAASDPVALDRLAWVLSVATPTGVWPEVIHPRTGGGSAGAGHHAATGAAVLLLVRDLLLRETGGAPGQPTGLALCSLLPDGWRGQGIEVHDAPTDFGSFSFGLRWHGPRPALLWELDPHPGVGDLVLTAPGLDPGWRGSGLRGEALLAAPPDRDLPEHDLADHDLADRDLADRDALSPTPGGADGDEVDLRTVELAPTDRAAEESAGTEDPGRPSIDPGSSFS